MAAVVNLTTLQYFPAVNTPDYDPSEWMINPDVSAVSDIPLRYWKLDIPHNAVVPQNESEQAATDAALTAAEAAVPAVPFISQTWFNRTDGVHYLWDGARWLSTSRDVLTFTRDGELIESNLALGMVFNEDMGFTIPANITIIGFSAQVASGNTEAKVTIYNADDDSEITSFIMADRFFIGGASSDGSPVDIAIGTTMRCGIAASPDADPAIDVIVHMMFAYHYIA